MIFKAIKVSISKPYLNKIQLLCNDYKWEYYVGLIITDVPTML